MFLLCFSLSLFCVFRLCAAAASLEKGVWVQAWRRGARPAPTILFLFGWGSASSVGLTTLWGAIMVIDEIIGKWKHPRRADKSAPTGGWSRL
jgi:hypothetical protein